MEPNTPATQAFPQGSPIDDNPSYDNPIDPNPIQDRPIDGKPVQEVVVPAGVNTPARPKGPNAAPVVLGLVALVMAALIIANETMGLRVDWARLGPGGIVGVGLVLVVLGAVGLVRRRGDS